MIFLWTCSSEKNKSSSILTSYTNSLIPTDGEVNISFTSSFVEQLKSENISLDKLIQFTPKIKGDFTWFNNSAIFKPKSLFSAGKKYTVTVKSSIVNSDLSDFKFSFETFFQDFSLNNVHLERRSGAKDNQLFQIKGELESSNPIPESDFAELIKLTGLSSTPIIDWELVNSRNAKFTIDSIPAKENAYNIKLELVSKEINANQKIIRELNIPQIGKFEITDHHVVQGNNAHIKLYFSENLALNQNLNGLILILNTTGVKSQIDKNIISIWPNEKLIGNYTLKVNPGIISSNGQEMKVVSSFKLVFRSKKPAVEIINKGVIIPENSNLNFPFKTVGLKAVDVEIIRIFSENIPQFLQENSLSGHRDINKVGLPIYRARIPLGEDEMQLSVWNTYNLSVAKLVELDTKSIYRIKFSFRKEYALYDCDDNFNKEQILKKEELNPKGLKNTDKYWKNPNAYQSYYPNNFNWRERNDPCKNSYYISDKFPTQNLFVSNLGLICKSNKNGNYLIFVSDISNATPLSSAKVSLVSLQNQVLSTHITDEDGFVEVASPVEPYFIHAEVGLQHAWLKLKDGAALPMSSFDVGGQKIENGLKTFIYGERGVWRPGDSLFLSVIVRDQSEKLPKDFPIVCELHNPSGLIYDKQINSKGLNGLYSFKFKTNDDVPTGNWTAIVKIGELEFKKQIRIETVKPNRLKVDLKFPADLILLREKTPSITLTSTWLQGGIAKGLKAEVDSKMRIIRKPFNAFKNYVFSDIRSTFSGSLQSVYNGKLNDKGQAMFSFSKDLAKQGPGMISATLIAKVFEKGGDFSINQKMVKLSPYESYCGVLIEEGKDYYDAYETDKEYTFPVVNVNYLGKAISNAELTYRLYRISNTWWWDHNAGDLGSYSGRQSTTILSTSKVKIVNGRGNISLKVAKNDWGHYLVQIEDPKSGHITSQIIYVDLPWGYRNRESLQGAGNAEQLIFTTDKDKYEIGEEAIISFSANKQSKALISVVKGNKVIETRYKNCVDGTNVFKLRIKENMEPNVYVSIEILQSYLNRKNDAPLRLYGVIPIMVHNPNTKLDPQIEAPTSIKPNSEFKLTVKEKNGKPMTYTLAIVEEGLLDLTAFKTPNPWYDFYRKEAYTLKTWDMYDDVNGVYNGRILQNIAIGGDENLEVKSKKSINRFKPIVRYIGPIHLDANKVNKHRFKMENYIGSVKVMVVAEENGAFGSAEEKIAVKQDLMVLGTLPRIAGPDETIKLPISIFVHKPAIKQVKLSVQTEGPISVIGSQDKMVTIEDEGESLVNYEMKAGSAIGHAKIKITASANGIKSIWEIDLPIRNPNPIVRKQEKLVIPKKQTIEKQLTAFGVKGTNSLQLNISQPGIPNLNDRLDYLINYPYGCVEQTVSSVFPQIYLDEWLDLSRGKKLEIKTNVEGAFSRLKNFVLPNGALSYWPGNNEASLWGSIYALQFLQLAKEKGYEPPSQLYNRLLNSVKSDRFSDLTYSNDAQTLQIITAYRLFTLSLCGQADFAEMNRMRNTLNSLEAGQFLAGAYTNSGRPELARNIMAKFPQLDKKVSNRYYWRTYGSPDRIKAVNLINLIALKDEHAIQSAIELTKDFNSKNWMSTQSIAWVFYALNEYQQWKGKSESGLNCELIINGDSERIQSDKRIVQKTFIIEDELSELKLKNLMEKSDLLVEILSKGQPIEDAIKTTQMRIQLNVNYTDISGNRINPNKLRQGESFIAQISVKNNDYADDFKNLALTQIFPSGWEIINTRLFSGLAMRNDQFDYQDIRDDRVNLFFSLNNRHTKTFRILLNASYQGRFYLPPTECDAMYDGSVHANNEGRWVEVY